MGDCIDVPYFAGRLECILTCIKCCRKLDNPTYRSCGHVCCSGCIGAGNEGICEECQSESMENGNTTTKLFPQLFTLHEFMGEISISEFHACRRCEKRTRISELWVCLNCNVAVACSACMMGKCSHGDTERPPRSVEAILNDTKAQYDRWQPMFKVQLDALSPQIKKLSTELDLVAGRVVTIGDIPAFFGRTLEGFQREMACVKTEFTSVEGKAKDLEALIQDNGTQVRNFPTNVVVDTMAHVDHQCGLVRTSMAWLAPSFRQWIQYCRGFGNVQLEAACQLDDDDGGEQGDQAVA